MEIVFSEIDLIKICFFLHNVTAFKIKVFKVASEKTSKNYLQVSQLIYWTERVIKKKRILRKLSVNP